MTHLSRLTLTAFRNYAGLRLDIGPQPIVLTGANGAGKTNLLEAISLLGPGRGLRSAKLSDVGMIGTNSLSLTGEVNSRWAVAAAIHTQAGTRAIGTGQEDSPDRRVVRIDGANRAQGSLAEICSILWITPAMDRLFAEPSSARRRFLDRIVYGYDPAHATRLNRYEQGLRERQKLLEVSRHPAWLDGIEAVLAETGVAVAASRLAVGAKLNQACAAMRDAAFPQPQIAVSGAVESYLAGHSALLTEDWFRGELARNRAGDAAAARCQLGVHRSDLVVHYAGKNMPAALCSTGEQKALLIALVLANAQAMQDGQGDKPILLLDEITAHLDEMRRAALFDRIAALGLQAWMSGTEPGAFESLQKTALYLQVRDGAVDNI
jgi:DNA replication and repair protein RecF